MGDGALLSKCSLDIHGIRGVYLHLMPTRDADVLAMQVREKGLEILLHAEPLAILASGSGVAAFGSLCLMVGACCQHVAAGRLETARQVVSLSGSVLVQALPEGRERDSLADLVEDLLAILEDREIQALH
jgi:hypothetical protein